MITRNGRLVLRLNTSKEVYFMTNKKEIYPDSFTEKQKKYLSIKYRMDFIIALFAVILLLPVYFVLGVLIFLDNPGPVFFKQKRVGEHKELFNLYKFRTMKTCTPHDTPTHLLENPEQYITRMGGFLRKTSLDELPQLFNILQGKLSLVAPRPALWNQYDLIEERDKYGANDIRPGLTGWAQIHGRDELEIADKAKLDGYYVKHFGWEIDIRCFLGTFPAVFRKDGVVEGGTGELRRNEKKEINVHNSKKRVLILTNHSFMLWQFRRELIAELRKTYTVILSMPCGEHTEDFRTMGCKIIDTPIDRRGINPITDFKLLNLYFAMMKKVKPDLVITYSIKPNIYGGYACSRLKIPYCVNVQGLGTAFQKKGLAEMVTIMYRAALRKARTVFFENEENAEEFQRRGIVPTEKQIVLHGAGINLEYYPYEPYTEKDGVHFLYVGRIMKEKGVDELFAAARQIKKEYEGKVYFDVVGFFEDEYKETVENLQKEGIIIFHGFQEDVRPFYKKASCVVLPSYHEGMSNVLLEGAATGKALITSNIPGCREAVEDSVSGFLCEPKSAKAVAMSMRKFMELSVKQREEMGIAGRARMEELFDKKKVVTETIKHLLSVD